MIRTISLFILFLLLRSPLIGQPKEIFLLKQGGFTSEGKVLKQKEVLKVLAVNQKAHEDFKKSMKTRTTGMTLFCIGGAMIATPARFRGGQSLKGLTVVGAALMGIGVGLHIKSKKEAREAVSIYNTGIKTSANLQPTLRLSIHPNAARLTLRL